MTRRGRAGDYQVAVPSYQRPTMVTAKTLPALAAGGVDPGRVTVFLHQHDPHLDAYLDVLPAAGARYSITDRRGINAQRAHIVDSYPAGTPLVQVDDDLTRLVEAVDAKRTRPIRDVHGFLRGMFLDTAARDLWVWGLSPTTNAFYMNPGKLTEGLRFCIGTVLGCFTRPGHPVHAPTVETKEDYALCLRAWWYDGAVLRNDGVAPDADHYSPGGCADLRTKAVEEASAAALEADWPGLVRRNLNRKSGYAEIKLAAKKRHAGHPTTTPVPGHLRRRVPA